jgi:aryl-alcohol dehydrogenase-like predicted oxidoreductase
MHWGDSALDLKVAGRVIDEATLVRIRERTREAGITFIDTAEGYGGGSSEARLGRLGFGTSGHVVATKFLPTFWRWTANAVVRSQKASNRRLGVEACDLSFIHSPVHLRSPAVWIRGAARAIRAGHLKTLGVSNFDAAQVRSAAAVARQERIPLVANQLMFSLLVYRSEALQQTVKTCRDLGLTVVGYGDLGQGLLTDGLTPERFASNRLARRVGLTMEQLAPLREAIHACAVRHRKTMSQVCLQWAISKGVVPLVGTRSLEQLEHSLGALDFTLDADETARLDAAALDYSTFNRPFGRRLVFLVFISLLMLAFKWSRAFSPQVTRSRPNSP